MALDRKTTYGRPSSVLIGNLAIRELENVSHREPLTTLRAGALSRLALDDLYPSRSGEGFLLNDATSSPPHEVKGDVISINCSFEQKCRRRHGNTYLSLLLLHILFLLRFLLFRRRSSSRRHGLSILPLCLLSSWCRRSSIFILLLLRRCRSSASSVRRTSFLTNSSIETRCCSRSGRRRLSGGGSRCSRCGGSSSSNGRGGGGVLCLVEGFLLCLCKLLAGCGFGLFRGGCFSLSSSPPASG